MKRRLGLALLALGLALAPSPASAQGETFCQAGQVPTYVFGYAALHGWLGDLMGGPLECERPTTASGDTSQRTTRGLAYFKAAIATTVFTDGYRHWSAGPLGRACWAGTEDEPPTEPLEVGTFVASPAPPTVADAFGPGEALQLRFTPAPYDVSAQDVFAALSGRCLPIMAGTLTTAEADPEGLLNQPNGYTSRVTWRDGRVRAAHDVCAPTGCTVDDGGAVEVYITTFLANRRAAETGGTAYGNVLLRLAPGMPADAQVLYAAAMADALRPAPESIAAD